MRQNKLALYIAMAILVGCATPAPGPGVILPDQGGAPSYQHSVERSRFVLNRSTSSITRQMDENGFSKFVGENGVVAIDRRSGLFIAAQSGRGDKDPRIPSEMSERNPAMDPDTHNKRVMEYFRSTGIPKDQIAGVHATTYLSSSGSLKDERPAPPKIDGYTSVLSRTIGGVPVLDSVAWARMNERGEVLAEWVYWPTIPAKVLMDAKRLKEMVVSTQMSNFLARLPTGLPPGKIVIRHSSPTSQESFEAFASYDVVERKMKKMTPEAGEAYTSVTPSGMSVIRHFDVEGVERRLPQEKRELSAAYPSKRKQPLMEQKEH